MQLFYIYNTWSNLKHSREKEKKKKNFTLRHSLKALSPHNAVARSIARYHERVMILPSSN